MWRSASGLAGILTYTYCIYKVSFKILLFFPPRVEKSEEGVHHHVSRQHGVWSHKQMFILNTSSCDNQGLLL